MDSDESAVGKLRRKLFMASHSDELHANVSIERVVAWAKRYTGSDSAISAAEPLIRHFKETSEWLPNTTAEHSIEDLAALLPVAKLPSNAKPGRPKGTKGEKRVGVECAIADGDSDDDIANDFDITPGYVAKIRKQMTAESSPNNA